MHVHFSVDSDTRLSIHHLRAQLAQVDVEIKQLLQSVEKKQTEETDLQNAVQKGQDQPQRIMENLQKAAESYEQILGCASILA